MDYMNKTMNKTMNYPSERYHKLNKYKQHKGR
jgi:hypothetical protein